MTTQRRRVTHPEGGKLITKQADGVRMDTNHIVNRWITHGVLPLAGTHPTFGDFSNRTTYHEALSRIRQAETDFATLPANVRRHCNNDLGEYLECVYDPNRRAELEALGLVDEHAPADAPPAAVVEENPQEPGTEEG